MNAVRLRNFRCFGEEQEVALAPLTLLVGENSTGKTSFMAAIRALWDMFYGQQVPDFKEQPYDLGSFADIVHSPTTDVASHSPRFEFGLVYSVQDDPRDKPRRCRFDVSFGQNGAAPIPRRLRLSDVERKVWVEHSLQDDGSWQVAVGTPQGPWRPSPEGKPPVIHGDRIWPFFVVMDIYTRSNTVNARIDDDSPLLRDASRQSAAIEPDTWKVVEQLCRSQFNQSFFDEILYASAPVRSKPRRTYDPSRVVHDPEGDDTPTYLGNLALQRRGKWRMLRKELVRFGVDSGLFEVLSVRSFGDTASDPFQLQIKEAGSQDDSPLRNLVDVGYGVSQVLPVVTELLRSEAPPVFLLQQPEVHLHPSAQAALGSLFCQVAQPGKLLIVETHSDYLLDRIRMDLRDGKTDLRPEDVAILFFERTDRAVSIHRLSIDGEGNVLNEPRTYRAFFMREVQRSLGL